MKKLTSLPFLFTLGTMMLLLSACGSMSNQVATRSQYYTALYEAAPKSILVMPPINKTNNVDAKQSMYMTLHESLAERGYYVFSPFLAMELMQTEGAEDSELFFEGNLKPFKQVFGADAALFTIITKWQKASLLNRIDVEIQYILKDTETRAVLFDKKARLTVDCSTGINSGNALLNLIVDTVTTALTDNVVGAQKANSFVLRQLPAGGLSPFFEDDKSAPADEDIITATVQR